MDSRAGPGLLFPAFSCLPNEPSAVELFRRIPLFRHPKWFPTRIP